MLDTASVAFFIQWVTMYNDRRKYRKAAVRLEAPFARTFQDRIPKG